MAFSRQIVTGILRDELGFKGYVNSDSGIIEERGGGREDSRITPATERNYTVADRTALAIRAGTDVLSEFRSKDTIIDLVRAGALDEVRDLNPAAERLLTEQVARGRCENPYVKADAAAGASGTPGPGAALAGMSPSTQSPLTVPPMTSAPMTLP